MRAEKDADIFALKMGNQISQKFLAHDRVQAERWIIEDHELGPMSQCEQQRHANTLSFGEMPNARLQRQLEAVAQLPGPFAIPCRIKRRDERKQLANAHP